MSAALALSAAAILAAISSRQRGSRSIESLAFARWFDGSQVVDERGKPRIVYHHTHRDFDTFDRLREASARRGVKIDTVGSWFTSRSGPIYGPKVQAFYLSIQNPKVYEGEGGWWRMYRDAELMVKYRQPWAGFRLERQSRPEDLRRQVEELPPKRLHEVAKAYGLDPKAIPKTVLTNKVWDKIAAFAVEDYRNKLISQGFDGIAILGDTFDGMGQDAFIAFEPTQIKSVDNAGTWDASDPRVSFNALP